MYMAFVNCGMLKDTPVDLAKFKNMYKKVIQRKDEPGSNWLAEENRGILYHPSDRSEFSVLEDEPIMAEICRSVNKSLVIFTPQRHGKGNWKSIYDGNPNNRPAIRGRWSTGNQEQSIPVLLGGITCDDNGRCAWFSVKPKTQQDYNDFTKPFFM